MAHERGTPGSASAEIEKYLNLLAKDPGSRVFAPLAEAYRKAGLLDDAIETAREGLKVHPNYLGGRVALARAYFEKRQFAEARKEAEKVAAAASDNLAAHKLLGQIAYEQHDLREAERSFRAVLSLDPRDHDAKQFLSNLGSSVAAPGSPAGKAAPPPPPPAPQRPAAPPEEEELPPLEGLEPHRVEEPPARPAEAATGPPGAGVPEPPPPPLQGIDDLDGLELEEIGLEEIPTDIRPEPDRPAPAAASRPSGASGDDAPAAGHRSLGPPPRSFPRDDIPLEIFSREPWKGREGEAPPSPGGAEPAPGSPHEEDSPFEVFGRPARAGPPESSKGEQEAFQEIELEPTAHAPAAPEEESADASSFEIYTKDTGPAEPRELPPPGKRGEEEGFREIDLGGEGRSAPEGEQGAPVSLDEEIPRVDISTGFEPFAPRAGDGREEGSLGEDASAPGTGPEAAPAEAVDEIPAIDLSREMAEAEEQEEASVPPGYLEGEADEEAAEEEAGVRAEPAAGTGVFNTETLASIYLQQGFHDRAAEIYRRLLAERPDDEGLRRKLEEAAAAARGVVPVAAQAPSPAAGEARPDETVRRLEALLEAFRGGRPR